MGKGRFVTLEGIEGSGKSSQIRRISKELVRLDVPFILTFEPGATNLGREIRQVLLDSKGARRRPEAELLLYLADRLQHLEEIVKPGLEAGKLVISDRYHDATLAYQGYARGLGIDWIENFAGKLGILEPDLTLLLDLDVETGLARARERNKESATADLGRFEAEDLTFHRSVRKGYLLLAGQNPNRYEVIDARGDSDEVFSRIIEALSRYL